MKSLFLFLFSLVFVSAEERYQFRDGHLVDQLPDYIQQVSGFGERPDWSADSRRLLFVEKPMGEVYELDLKTGLTHPKTRHFTHYGFTRAIYLANGDILLSGPRENYDEADRDSRNEARHLCWLSVLPKSGNRKPIPLDTLAAEGPAVSREAMRLAWTHRDQQDPTLPENSARHFLADIVYDDGKPKLANQRVVFDSRQLPFALGGASLETQNLLPPNDRGLIFSTYVIEGGTNTDTYLVDLESGEFQNLTRSPEFYDEPEGVYPDGKYTLVEHGPSQGRAWPMCDLFQLKLDGSGEMRRITRFAEYRGFKGTQGVISPDGKQLCFQLGKSGDEAGVGYGFFVMDLEAAEAAGAFGEWTTYAATEGLEKQRLADQFVAAWQAGEPLPALSRIAPEITLSQAYDLQRAWVRATLDEAGIGGVKGGVVTPGGQKWLGVEEPVGAILRASGRFEGTDTPEISLQQFPGLKLESEIGFVIGKPITRRLETVAEFKAHVSGIVPAIELISGAWEGAEGKPSPADLAGINVTAAGTIIGDPISPGSLDPKLVTLELSREGEVINTAPGVDCWRGPWETGLWLAQFAHRQGIELQPGQIIICGALGKILEAEPGPYHYNAGGLGAFSFSVR